MSSIFRESSLMNSFAKLSARRLGNTTIALLQQEEQSLDNQRIQLLSQKESFFTQKQQLSSEIPTQTDPISRANLQAERNTVIQKLEEIQAALEEIPTQRESIRRFRAALDLLPRIDSPAQQKQIKRLSLHEVDDCLIRTNYLKERDRERTIQQLTHVGNPRRVVSALSLHHRKTELLFAVITLLAVAGIWMRSQTPDSPAPPPVAPSPQFSLPKNVSPSIAIVTSDGTSLSSNETMLCRAGEPCSFTITAFPSSNNYPVQELQLIDPKGRTVSPDERLTKKRIARNEGKVEKQWTIAEVQGRHQFQIKTVDRLGTRKRPLSVLFHPHDRGRLFVLMIGVDQSGSRDALAFPAQDAESLMRECLKRSTRVFAEVVPALGGATPGLLLNDEATPENVQRSLNWLRNNVSGTDVALIFFGGHADIEMEQFRLHFAGENGVVPFRSLTPILAEIKGRTLIWLDTCCSRGAVHPLNEACLKSSVKRTEGVNPVVVQAACERNELVLEDRRRKHGALAAALLAGINGAGASDESADQNGDRVVTLGELNLFLQNWPRRDGRKFPITDVKGIAGLPLTLIPD